MKKQTLIALAIILGAIGISALMIMLRPQPQEQARLVQAPVVQTEAFMASDEPLFVNGSGTVEPAEEVIVGAQVSGRLTYVNPSFVEGKYVGAGATLIRIDPRDYRNEVDVARADVAAQDVAVLRAQEERRIAQEELELFNRRQDGNAAFVATIDANDYASRIRPPSGAQPTPDRTRSASTGQLATGEPQLRSARAARDRARARLTVAQTALSRTSVSSPFSGIVRSENAAIGSLVQPGQELGRIVATSSFLVRIGLTEAQAALIPGLLEPRSGRIPASVFFDYGGQTYRWAAYVDRADAILDAQTRLIDVFLRVPDPLRGGRLVTLSEDDSTQGGGAPPLLLGSFVRAEIIGDAPVRFASIPAAALRPGNEIWVVRDGRLRILPVRVLQRTETRAYVTLASLEDGGRLVTSSLRSPTDGMQVRVRAEPQAKKPVQTNRAPAKGKASDE